MKENTEVPMKCPGKEFVGKNDSDKFYIKKKETNNKFYIIMIYSRGRNIDTLENPNGSMKI